MFLFVLLTPFTYAITTALTYLGFGSLGPIAGSLAAFLQASLYGAAVPAGGLFAFLQAAGMGGAALSTAAVSALLTSIFLSTWGFISWGISAAAYQAWLEAWFYGNTTETLWQVMNVNNGTAGAFFSKFF
jgi:hypothetical protein